MSVGMNRFFQVREAGALSVIQFRISITAPTTNVHEVQQEISEFVAKHDCQKLVFDLSSTAYLPSNILGVLVVLSSRGIEVHLGNASKDIANVIEVTGLGKRIKVNEFELSSYGPPDDETQREATAVVAGYFVACPECQSRQRLDKHLLGKKFQCTNCRSDVHVDADLMHSADELYCECPLCEREMLLPAELPGRKGENVNSAVVELKCAKYSKYGRDIASA